MMTKAEKEKAIIESLKKFASESSDGYGDYHLWEHFFTVVGQAMGYVDKGFTGYTMSHEDEEKVREISRRMISRGLIRVSKSGKMFKVC